MRAIAIKARFTISLIWVQRNVPKMPKNQSNNNMNHTQFLEDFVDTYVADPSKRAITETGVCQYLMDDGRKCAIGRHILPGTYNKTCENQSAYGLVMNNPSMFPDWMSKLNKSFINSVQSLHDGTLFWDDNGLTSRGLKCLNELRVEAASLDQENC